MNTTMKVTAIAALTGAAIAGAAGIANATPQQPAPNAPHPVTVALAPGVQYTSDSGSGSAELVTPFGVVKQQASQVAVADNAGNTLYGIPNVTTPEHATPAQSAQTDAALPAPNAASAPKTPAEKQAAIMAAIRTAGGDMGMATGLGAAVGGVSGMLIGCAFGGALGIVAGPASLATCMLGAATVGGLGAMIGGAVVGVPVGISSAAYQYGQLVADGVL